jgi:hypothetical protein
MATHGEKRWPPVGRFDGRLRGGFHGHRQRASAANKRASLRSIQQANARCNERERQKHEDGRNGRAVPHVPRDLGSERSGSRRRRRLLGPGGPQIEAGTRPDRLGQRLIPPGHFHPGRGPHMRAPSETSGELTGRGMDVPPHFEPTQGRCINMVISSENTLEADAGTRTRDPFITSEVLYQLSYVGVCRDFLDLAPPLPGLVLQRCCKI